MSVIEGVDEVEIRALLATELEEALVIGDELAEQAVRRPSDPITRDAAAEYQRKRQTIRRLRRALTMEGRG